VRALVSAVGTRGDVQPAVALAVALRDLGHEARLCVSPNFVAWAEGLGFAATAVGVEMRARAGAPKTMPDLITDQFEAVGSAADGCDVIVGAGGHQYAAPSIAEVRGVPYVNAVYAPVALPSPGDERWADEATAWNERALERVNANRARLGLTPVDDVLSHLRTERPWLAADPVLAPLPATPGLTVRQTGAWMLADPAPLPPAVEAFLAAGEPPVYAGFGSMPAAPDAGRAVIAAARAAGRRVILAQGWAELELPGDAPDCLAAAELNHEALFPRVAAVVHHGGAGTTVAAARAGVPQVIQPMFSDQFYWAERVRALGIGAASLAGALELAGPAAELAPRISLDGADVAARALAETA
jgi:vancomycin aglycone glucosyltransferase